MAIWFQPYSIETLNQRSAHTLASFLGIEFTAIDEHSLTATMPANQHNKQPLGIVHGGANVVLAETVASTAANCVIDIELFYCVGMEINANHLRPVIDGVITAVARPIHVGRTTQVWHIDLHHDQKLSCVSRMTAAVVPRHSQPK